MIFCAILGIYLIVLLARAVLSWFPISYDSPAQKIKEGLDVVTEPVLRPIRSVIPPVRMGSVGLDISFLVVFFVLMIILNVIC